MKIAHVTATFPPYLSGTGNVCYNNARELTRLGHNVHVYTPKIGNCSDEEILDGIFVHRLEPFIKFGNAFILPGLASLKNVDVIHLHFPFFGGEFTAIAANKQKIPFIITYHQDVQLRGALNYIERILRRTVSTWVLRHAERVLFTSMDYSKISYARKILRGRKEHIGELPNGVDPNYFSPGTVEPSFARNYKSSDEDTIVLFVAQLDRAHYFKGLPILLKTLSQLPDTVKAIIIGDGDLKNNYENIAQELGLQNRVFFAGQVSSEDLVYYYRMADVTVLPSITMGEAFGLVLLESLACGTPVIASNLPGVRTVVEDSVDGYLVQPGDVDGLHMKLQQILSMPDQQRITMGVAGQRKVEQEYTWELAGQRLEQIYRDVINHHVG